MLFLPVFVEVVVLVGSSLFVDIPLVSAKIQAYPEI